MRIDELFNVAYGNKFDFNKMVVAPEGVNFIGRSGQNQGVSGTVARVLGVEPYAAGLITVALGGASRLATFVQQRAFYTAQNVAVLTPKSMMSLEEKLFWATCIRANRYRYEGFGREANRTLHLLELPDEADVGRVRGLTTIADLVRRVPNLSGASPERRTAGATVGELFEVKYGQSLELNRLVQTARPAGVNFVSRTDRRNGVSARVLLPDGVAASSPGSISVALGGSPLASFLQPEPFVCGRDVAVLSARERMSDAEKLFWAMCIRSNRYRFSYGRQANRTLPHLRLPALPPGLTSSENVQNVLSDVRAGFERAAGAFDVAAG